MFGFVFIILAILSGVQGTTYSLCNGACSVSFTPACGTMFYVDGTQWSCSQFKIPASYPAAIGSCPGDIVLNQTDNTVVCLNRRCPGQMLSYTTGWKCVDSTCSWGLVSASDYSVPGFYPPSMSDFDYICPIPDCQGIPVKSSNTGWSCNSAAYYQGYNQGETDYLPGHIGIIIIVVLLLLILEAVVLLVALRQCLWKKAQQEAKLIQLNTTMTGNKA